MLEVILAKDFIKMFVLRGSDLSLPIPRLQYFLSQPLTSCSHNGNVAQDSLLPL